MLAVRIHAYGDPSVLGLDPIPVPAPGAGELLVKVVAGQRVLIDAGAGGAATSGTASRARGR
jgi:hypothetical protein